MEFRCIPDTLPTVLDQWDGDCLAVGLFAGSDTPEAGQPEPVLLAQLAARLDPSLPGRLEQRRFKAKPGTCLSLERLGGVPRTLILVGLGAPADFDLAGLRQACAAASQAAATAGARHLGLAMPLAGLESGAAARTMAEAARLALFSDQRFKGEPEPRNLPETVSLIGLAEVAQPTLAAVSATCAGVELARELVAAPPNVATPQHLADTAAAISHDFGLELRVLERSDCEALGMGSYLAVAQGSDLAPKFIHLTYRPPVRPAAGWCWWARASPSIPAATTSKPPAPRSR